MQTLPAVSSPKLILPPRASGDSEHGKKSMTLSMNRSETNESFRGKAYCMMKLLRPEWGRLTGPEHVSLSWNGTSSRDQFDNKEIGAYRAVFP